MSARKTAVRQWLRVRTAREGASWNARQRIRCESRELVYVDGWWKRHMGYVRDAVGRGADPERAAQLAAQALVSAALVSEDLQNGLDLLVDKAPERRRASK